MCRSLNYSEKLVVCISIIILLILKDSFEFYSTDIFRKFQLLVPTPAFVTAALNTSILKAYENPSLPLKAVHWQRWKFRVADQEILHCQWRQCIDRGESFLWPTSKSFIASEGSALTEVRVSCGRPGFWEQSSPSSTFYHSKLTVHFHISFHFLLYISTEANQLTSKIVHEYLVHSYPWL